MNENLLERVESDFGCHRVPEAGAYELEALRDLAKKLANFIVAVCPAGREQSSALTRLEEAMFHANAGIARQYPVVIDQTDLPPMAV